MNRKWNKTAGFMAIVAISALLVSSNFFSQTEEEFRYQYDEERLKNDSLMGEIQMLQKQLWEKEQELRATSDIIDSLAQVCANPGVGNNTNQ